MPILLFLWTITGYEYLDVDPVASRTTMGYALFGDGYSIDYNPAGLAFSFEPYYSISYLNYIAGTHLGYLGYENNQLGVGIHYLYSGSIKKTDALGNEYGNFSASFLDLNVGKGFFLGEFGFGITIKGVYENIDTLYSLGSGIDLGLLYLFPETEVQLGFSIKNIGIGIKPFTDKKESFPYEINLAGVKRIDDSWIGLDLVKNVLQGTGFRIGGSYAVTENFNINASYNSLLSSMKTGSSGFDFVTGLIIGFSIKKGQLQISYCYAPYFDLGQGHRLTISIGG